jgi:hypothetical protein
MYSFCADPHEKETLLPPLVGLQVSSTSVDGSTLVVKGRFSLNMTSLTLEQVVSKKQKLLHSMGLAMALDVREHFIQATDEHVDIQFVYNHPMETFSHMEGVEEHTITCHTSGVIIKGTRYMERGKYKVTFPHSLCQAEYDKLSGTKQMQYVAILPWRDVPSEVEARVQLLEALVTSMTAGHQPDFFNNDQQFKAAVQQTFGMKYAVREHLVYLDLSLCNLIFYVPDVIGQLVSLRMLKLDGCKRLRELPDTLIRLQKLEELSLMECPSLQQLPDAICGLNALMTLRVQGEDPTGRSSNLVPRDGLISLPENIGALLKLKTLVIADCPIESLPQSMSSLVSLQYLELRRCKNLASLPDLSATHAKDTQGHHPSLPAVLQPTYTVQLEVDCYQLGHLFLWKQLGFKSFAPNVWDMNTSADAVPGMNNLTTVCLFADGSSSAIKAISRDAFESVASDVHASGRKMRFAFASEAVEAVFRSPLIDDPNDPDVMTSKSIRDKLGLPTRSMPQLIAVNTAAGVASIAGTDGVLSVFDDIEGDFSWYIEEVVVTVIPDSLGQIGLTLDEGLQHTRAFVKSFTGVTDDYTTHNLLPGDEIVAINDEDVDSGRSFANVYRRGLPYYAFRVRRKKRSDTAELTRQLRAQIESFVISTRELEVTREQ